VSLLSFIEYQYWACVWISIC